ncbi:AcrIF11 family anti-CRISPR ADP-ribosyltransferase [Pectobacterium versatile]|uniref:hypothetical protein n=1 Tax=Pectobacterium versatile TaxID=2488639 RepID=UPI001F3B4552|nr:hypothetical protein [Pectobacterium versatile]
MKLFHGSSSNAAPVIKIGAFSTVEVNVFDGIFASADWDAAASHGNAGRGGNVFSYYVDDENIAESRDLDARFEEVYEFLRAELGTHDVESIADHIIWDKNQGEEFAERLSPRLDSDIGGAYSWEMQRPRGRVAAHLGFDAVEMDDEHGTSYLIVNPAIIAE